MKYLNRLSSGIVLLLFSVCASYSQNTLKPNASKSGFISLIGEPLAKGNPVAADGNIHTVNTPLLQLLRTKVKPAKGTILLLTGGAYDLLRIKNEGKKTAAFLNATAYDVAILEYHIGKENKNLALTDALEAFRLVKEKQKDIGLSGTRICIMGLSSGGHLAARLVQRLGSKEQPDDLVLISPANPNETLPGTVNPLIMPPIATSARLFVAVSAKDDKVLTGSCTEYFKTWKGYDGQAMFKLADGAYTANNDVNPVYEKSELASILKTYLGALPAVEKPLLPNPATVAVAGNYKDRHIAKLQLVAKEKFDLILVGNSITHNFEKPAYQAVWNQFFAPRKALNLGYSGYRTENILWNIENGELDGQSPKVVVLEIGTNNVDEKHYPTRHTSGQLAGGIEAIVTLLRKKLPDTKIILLRCFPGSYDGPNPTSHRAILERASDMVSKLADGKHIFYCDVNHVFLKLDGSINHDMMNDWLHPSPAGAKAWAQAMEPLLSELMGDKSLDTDVPANTAIVPVSKLENDSYNWWDRHADVMRVKDSINPEIVLIGNSITHFWGGEPLLKYTNGKPRNPNGPKSWAALFGQYKVLNLGFGWDRTQNVLWRLDHGELDGLHPRTVVVDIGTNNTSQTNNARMNTAPEIVEGIRAVCMRVRSKVPGAKIILMAVFPRENSPTHPRRLLINEINKQLAVFAKEQQITLVDIGPGLLAPDGTFIPGMTLDYCHPTDKGYQVWADGIKDLLE